MKTNWPVRPVKRSTSSWTCSGVKATKSTTASNSRSPSAERADAGSRMSPSSQCVLAGSGRPHERPRLSTCNSMPTSTARCAQAELICPEPPMNKTSRAVIAQDRKGRRSRSRALCAAPLGGRPAGPAHHEARDDEDDDHADDRADQAAEIEGVVVADPQSAREDQVADERPDQAQDDGDRPRPRPVHAAEDVVGNERPADEPGHEAEDECADHAIASPVMTDLRCYPSRRAAYRRLDGATVGAAEQRGGDRMVAAPGCPIGPPGCRVRRWPAAGPAG